MLLITGLIYNPFRRQMNSLFLEQFFKAKLHSQNSIVTVAKMRSNDSVLSGCEKVDEKKRKSRFQLQQISINVCQLLRAHDFRL